jgi:hypothetical protein
MVLSKPVHEKLPVVLGRRGTFDEVEEITILVETDERSGLKVVFWGVRVHTLWCAEALMTGIHDGMRGMLGTWEHRGWQSGGPSVCLSFPNR